VKLHRGEAHSNGLTRTLGGYLYNSKDKAGPCHPDDDGKVRNVFHTTGKYSQEEFPMAFMSEGGRYTPPKHKIGSTLLKPGIDRGPVFRCIDKSENTSKNLLAEMCYY